VSAPIVLAPRLDSSAAVQLAGMLREREGADLVLDASRVELLGASALQTLIVAATAWRETGAAFNVANLPCGIGDQLAALGLVDLSILEGARA